jgi:chaperone modulatory protein CbpM
MMRFSAVVALFPDLQPVELTSWIEHRWVQPEPHDVDIWIFHDIDIARVRLIYDLRRDLDTSEETVPVLLALLDQVYDLRRKLKSVAAALEDASPELREKVLGILRDGEQ